MTTDNSFCHRITHHHLFYERRLCSKFARKCWLCLQLHRP